MKKYALLRIDMSMDFIKAQYEIALGVFVNGGLVVPAGESIIPAIKELSELAREKNLFIADVLDKHTIDDSEFFAPAGPTGEGWPIHNIKHLAGSMTVIELDIAGIRTYGKTEFDGFTNSYLAKDLKLAEIDTIFLTGLVGNFCVEASAKGALENGFKVIFVKECICFLPDIENDISKKEEQWKHLSELGEVITLEEAKSRF